ncbi:MAG TPA: cation transporter [Ktedonobacteraceae bacterium]|nr:cation transporter [Ktedonobacteraceae bacterium]
MVQQVRATSDTPLIQKQQRAGQVRLGIWIELISLFWMVIEASVAITAGFIAHSISLEGFGIDSIIELLAGGVLLWRLLVEQRGGSIEAIGHAERRAAWITAFSLFGLALYIVASSAFALFTQSHPQVSWWGIGLAIASALIMPLLWQSKLRVARHINSAALKADAMCSVTCAYMSFTLLAGLLLNTLFGLWWADALAALILVYFIVREGREALHEAQTGEACCCDEEECEE